MEEGRVRALRGWSRDLKGALTPALSRKTGRGRENGGVEFDCNHGPPVDGGQCHVTPLDG